MNANVKHISEWFLKPKFEVEESKKPYHLTPVELTMLSYQYIQAGLLYTKPSHLIYDQKFSILSFIKSLKESLVETLTYFYPLAGQLVIDFEDNQCRVFVDCTKGPGARLCHASALGTTVSSILSPINNDVPFVVRSFFDEAALNYDGHNIPLLSIQVTELLDGIFVACSMNHAVADGASYWHFWNVWSDIHLHNSNKSHEAYIMSRLPIQKLRWFPDGCVLPTPLPFTNSNQFIKQFEAPILREKIFHFSSQSLKTLKTKVNIQKTTDNDSNNNSEISSFQALSALVWRSIVRANRVPQDQLLCSYILADSRHRLNPPLPKNYFGNCIAAIMTKTTAAELLENSLGWVASLLHQSVVNLNDKSINEFVKQWLGSPFCYHLEDVHDYNSIAMEHSPRFDLYGNDFGLGKPVAVRTGLGNKAVGTVFCYPGYEGGGSIDLEICLPPDSMKALENDEEFLPFVSISK